LEPEEAESVDSEVVGKIAGGEEMVMVIDRDAGSGEPSGGDVKTQRRVGVLLLATDEVVGARKKRRVAW
jgi:hypothetical protein